MTTTTKKALSLNGPNGLPKGPYSGAVQDGAQETWKYASASSTRRGPDELADSFAEWIAQMEEWQWFVTLTLNDKFMSGGFTKPGLGTARGALRKLIVDTQCTAVVAVFEWQRERGVPHVHALLAGCPAIIGEVAEAEFTRTYGMSRWKVYKPAGGAPRYLGKYLYKEMLELYMGRKGPWDETDFKVYTGGLTKKGTRRYIWDTQMGGLRV